MRKHRGERQSEEVQETEDAGNRKAVGLDRAIESLERRRKSRGEQRDAGRLKGQVVRGWTEKLLTRTTSGAIYAILIFVCLFLGRLATTVLVTAMAWLCCSEFFRMIRMAGKSPNEIVGLAGAIAYPVAAYLWGVDAFFIVTFVVLAVTACWYVLTPRASIGDVALTVFGPIYTSLLFSCVVLIRSCDAGSQGALLTLGVWGSMWANDAAAYFVGSRFGAHKLAPRISPHKSWEGFYGGLAGSLLVWCIVAALHVHGATWPVCVVAGIVVGVAGVLGDLFESRIKRGVGVKDSGNVMPGHGGMLDRSDSLLFGGMIAYLILLLGGIL